MSQLDEPAARVAVLEKAKELGLMSDRRGGERSGGVAVVKAVLGSHFGIGEFTTQFSPLEGIGITASTGF